MASGGAPRKLTPEEALQKRRTEYIAVNRAAKQSFELPSDMVGRELKNGADPHRYLKFGQLARRSFLASHANAPSGVVAASGGGFAVLARLLEIAPAAYFEYTAHAARTATIDDLRKALHRSTQTPNRLLDLPLHTNAAVELGFKIGEKTWGMESPHIVFEDTDEGPVLGMDEDHYKAHSDKSYRNHLPKHWQFCPARRLVMRRIWPAMVDAAATTPELFPHDLARSIATQTT